MKSKLFALSSVMTKEVVDAPKVCLIQGQQVKLPLSKLRTEKDFREITDFPEDYSINN